MTYRMLLCAGAAGATLGLIAGAPLLSSSSALAQVGQERPGQQERPGIARQVERGQEILKDIEGTWNVEVEIYDLAMLTETAQPGVRPEPRPGVRPEPRPGTGMQQIQEQLEQGFTRAGVSQQEARTHAQRLAQRIQQERPEQRELQQLIQQAMTQAGVSQQEAQQEAQRLAPQVHQSLQRGPQQPGQRPGQQPGQDQQQQLIQQIQQQLQQAFTRAGVSEQEARMHSERLSREIVQQRMEQQQIQQRLQSTLTQAGASQQEAQQEAQRIAPQIHQIVQRQQDQRGVDPRDDDTAPPPTPRDHRPGVDRPGVRDVDREAEFRAEGQATRSWKLNEMILEEEVNFSINGDGLNNENNNQQFNERAQELLNGDQFEGLGLFAYEPKNGDLVHVWADNTQSNLHYSIGHYDTAEQAMMFYTIDTQQVQMPRGQERPGVRPGERPGAGGPQAQQPGHRQDRPGVARQLELDPQGSRVMLRVVDENEHIVQYFRTNGAGQAEMFMQLTFTRDNGNAENNEY